MGQTEEKDLLLFLIVFITNNNFILASALRGSVPERNSLCLQPHYKLQVYKIISGRLWAQAGLPRRAGQINKGRGSCKGRWTQDCKMKINLKSPPGRHARLVPTIPTKLLAKKSPFSPPASATFSSASGRWRHFRSEERTRGKSNAFPRRPQHSWRRRGVACVWGACARACFDVQRGKMAALRALRRLRAPSGWWLPGRALGAAPSR